MSQKDIFNLVKDVIKKGKVPVLIFDFDGTISQDGSNPYSPFDTQVHPTCLQAITRASKLGIPIAAISNRSVAQLQSRLHTISNLVLRCTNGFENRTGSESIVDGRFYDFIDDINLILQSLQEVNLEIAGQLQDQQVEKVISSSYGRIYLERKAIGSLVFQDNDKKKSSKILTCGLSQHWNLNEVSPKNRVELVDLLRNKIKASRQNIDPARLIKLDQHWGIMESAKKPEDNGFYSFMLDPKDHQGKAHGLRSIYNQLLADNLNIGMIYMAGDSDADAEGMREAKKIEQETKGTIKAIGVHIEGDKFQLEIKKVSDIGIKSVGEHGLFLNLMVDVMSKSKMKVTL